MIPGLVTLEIQSIERTRAVVRDGDVQVTYRCEHQAPGARGTILACPLKVKVSMIAECEAVITVDARGDTQTETLDRLAANLERMATALRNRGEPNLGVYVGKTTKVPAHE